MEITVQPVNDRPTAEAATAAGWPLQKGVSLPAGGVMYQVCKPDWVEAILSKNPQLIGLLPCSLAVFEHDGKVLVAAGNAELIGEVSADPQLKELASAGDIALRGLVNTAADVGEGWEIAVTDNGMGVPAEQADRIFEMHVRLHAYNDIPGSGIGLSACRRVVELHGGRIWLDTSYTDGARFVVWLPKRPESGGQAAVPQSRSA